MTVWTTKRRAKNRYDLTAKLYDKLYAEEQEAKYKAAFQKLSNAPHGLVLDLGCGSGLLFKHLKGKAQSVVGVDLSRNLLLKAKQEAAGNNVFLVQADADHLPFFGSLFGVLFAFTVLQNMPKPVETLKETRRVLKPEAHIVVSGLKKAFPLERFKRILKKAGFQHVSLTPDDSLKCYIAVASQK